MSLTPDGPTYRLHPIPTVTGEEKPKPDRGRYCEENLDLIVSKLAVRLPESVIKITFSLSSEYYFVRGDFNHLATWVDHLKKNLALPSPNMPKGRDIAALVAGSPMSLFAIMRLHHAFADTVSQELPCAAILLRGASTAAGLPDASIVPSIRYASPEALKVEREARGIGQRNLGDLIRKTDKRVSTINVYEHLESGTGQGRAARAQHYRVTDELAAAVVKTLGKIKRVKGDEYPLDIDILFPLNPRLGPGNGKYTEPLPINNGNIV